MVPNKSSRFAIFCHSAAVGNLHPAPNALHGSFPFVELGGFPLHVSVADPPTPHHAVLAVIPLMKFELPDGMLDGFKSEGPPLTAGLFFNWCPSSHRPH